VAGDETDHRIGKTPGPPRRRRVGGDGFSPLDVPHHPGLSFAVVPSPPEQGRELEGGWGRNVAARLTRGRLDRRAGGGELRHRRRDRPYRPRCAARSMENAARAASPAPRGSAKLPPHASRERGSRGSNRAIASSPRPASATLRAARSPTALVRVARPLRRYRELARPTMPQNGPGSGPSRRCRNPARCGPCRSPRAAARPRPAPRRVVSTDSACARPPLKVLAPSLELGRVDLAKTTPPAASMASTR
jgi:hypothetical protein